jgi:hypothetical protein
MRATLAVLVAVALPLAGACSREPPRELPITTAEMPASFAYGGLGPASAHYRQGTDPRTGADVRQMIMTSRDEAAAFAVVALTGQYVFTPTAFRRRLASLLPPDRGVEWRDSLGATGPRPTKIVTFALPDRHQQCVGMERGVQDHHEAPRNVYSRAIALGYYCRRGPPFSPDEARRVAAALRTGG